MSSAMNNAKVYVNGQEAEHVPMSKLIRKPRYPNLPKRLANFLMKWRRFRIEYVIPDYSGVELINDNSKAGDPIVILYEIKW